MSDHTVFVGLVIYAICCMIALSIPVAMHAHYKWKRRRVKVDGVRNAGRNRPTSLADQVFDGRSAIKRLHYVTTSGSEGSILVNPNDHESVKAFIMMMKLRDVDRITRVEEA